MQNTHVQSSIPNSPEYSYTSATDYSAADAEPTQLNVTVHIPNNVHETIRRQKINRIYDILNPGNFR